MGSHKRGRESRTGGSTEFATAKTQNGHKTTVTAVRGFKTAKVELPSWLTDLDIWLLTKPVCTTILAILAERDRFYSTVECMIDSKFIQKSPSSSSEEDRALLQGIDCRVDAKLYHALMLRISERTILKKCASFVTVKLNRMR